MTLVKIPLKTPGTQWGGVVSDTPAPGGLAVFDDMVNFLCRKGRIITRPRLGSYLTPPDNARVRYMGTFLDAVNLYHTLMLTTQNAYMITNGPVANLLTYPLSGIATASVNTAGANYAVGDTGTIAGGSPLATYIVSEVDGSGGVVKFAVQFTGEAYSTGTNIATTVVTGSGDGAFTVDITAVNGFTDLSGTALPYGTAAILNRLYFANGSVPVLYADGETSVKVAGDVPGSAFFMTVNEQSLILANTVEPAPGIINSTNYPQRVRWSASGLPDEWDSTVDFTAGFNDLVEVPDVITGINTLGRNSYIYRTNGITVMYPTGSSGVGSLPFGFEDFSFAPLGVGNALPYSLATYGPRCVFVAEDDIYLFDGSTPQPIGYGNKKKIFKDLASASGDSVVGGILPVLGPNFDFLAYYLSIPGPDVAWVFGYDEKSWMRIDSASGFMTALNFVSVGT